MAITRAQQVKQMLRDGGRIGFQGGGKDMGSTGSSTGPGGQSPGPGGQKGGSNTGPGGNNNNNTGGNGGNQNQFEINRKAKLEQEAKKLADERAARNRENKRIATVKENKRLKEIKERKEKEKRDREEKDRIIKEKKDLSNLGKSTTTKFGTTTKPGTRSSKKTGIATATTPNRFLTDTYLDERLGYVDQFGNPIGNTLDAKFASLNTPTKTTDGITSVVNNVPEGIATADDIREQYGVLRSTTPKNQEIDFNDVFEAAVTDVERNTGLETQRLINEKLSDELKDYKPETKFPSLLSIFNLGTPGNIDYFRKNSIGGKINPVTKEPYGYGIDGFKDYMRNVSLGTVNTGGRPLTAEELRNKVGAGDGGNNNIIPISPTTTSSRTPVEETVDNRTELEKLLDARGAAYRFFADGGRVPAMAGGIMNTDVIGGAADGNIDEMGRQMYFIGKLVKKATRAVKKIAKSPIGKAALLYGAGTLGASFLGKTKAAGGLGKFLFGQGMKPGFSGPGIPGLFTKLGLTKTAGSMMPSALGGIALASLTPFLFQGEEEEEQQYEGPSIDIPGIRKDPYKAMGETYRFYAEGGKAEPVAKKTMPLIDMDGKEMDLRDEGGFVPLGRMERADDVPARLSKNEFVFTADAVRNAGEGDIDKGAEVMYNMMKNLESGGEVSEESQGLDGAREMFKTSQRLEEVI